VVFTPPTPACSASAATLRRPQLSDRPLPVTAADDPVAAFLAAHEDGAPVALTTAGTTAGPRVVVRSTRSWVDSFPTVQQLTGLDASSRLWVPGPLTATMNLFAAVHARVLGATLVHGPADASHAVVTPHDLDGLTDAAGLTVIVAGDRLDRARHDRAVGAGAHVHHYYGAAELSFVAWGSHAEDLTPFPGVDVQVRAGEIWVRTPYLCTRYDGPLGPLRVDPDGYATVGDRGSLGNGILTVAGRPSSVQVGTATVEPAEVEALLRPVGHGEIAVVGVPHARLGTVLAVALTEPADLDDLKRPARERLAGPARPRLWFHVSRLPRTTAGKVDRTALVSTVSGEDARPTRLL
jgi:long-chain acyl-CoA synthetase